MSWATRPRSLADLEAEHDAALADLEALQRRVDAGTADASAVTLAEYRLSRASRALTKAVVEAGHDGGDAA